MNKKKLLKLLETKMGQKKKLGERAQISEDVKELRSINEQIGSLNEEIEELRSIIDSMPDDEEEERGEHFVSEEEKRSANPIGSFNPIATYSMNGENRSKDSREIEYRQAFMDHVLKGTAIPEEFRASATTKTTDIGAVIPQTIVNKIVEKLNTYGYIYSRVTKTNIKGGVAIPKSAAKPKATWVGEGEVADKQKKSADGTVSFNYYKLQVRVAVTLEADTTSLAVFEQTVINNVYEAMIMALESAIISGTGTKQPLGIINDTNIDTKQKIAIKADELKSWDKWSKIFAKVPMSKRAGAVLILNDETWEGDILGMTDKDGQPIARVNIGLNGEDKPIFKGKEVIPVEEYLPSYEAAADKAVFGVIVNLSDYMLNSNMQMTVKKYFDEDTDEWITKATLIADGKLVDTQGVILLTKSTTTA